MDGGSTQGVRETVVVWGGCGGKTEDGEESDARDDLEEDGNKGGK